jgi:hypothetical protein
MLFQVHSCSKANSHTTFLKCGNSNTSAKKGKKMFQHSCSYGLDGMYIYIYVSYWHIGVYIIQSLYCVQKNLDCFGGAPPNIPNSSTSSKARWLPRFSQVYIPSSSQT